MVTTSYQETANALLSQYLKPFVTKIDIDGFYPEQTLRDLGREGLYGRPELPLSEFWPQTLELIEETAYVCGTTAFSLWCHTTAMVYVRQGQSSYLKQEILPKLASGEILGASGLSNPVKFYAGMEEVRLHAEKVSDGYRVSGFLPFVSNLGENHWFGIVAQVDENRRIIAFVPCSAEGLNIKELKGFLGLNGSATYNCRFRDVFIPKAWILSERADEFVKQIRNEFILNQAGLGIGLAKAAIRSMNALKEKQNGVNQFLRIQPDDLEARLERLREKAYRLVGAGSSSSAGAERSASGSDETGRGYINESVTPIANQFDRRILEVRLESAYLALDAASAGMLHCGGAAYVGNSNASRRLREAYFVAVVTPAVKHLEKLLQAGW